MGGGRHFGEARARVDDGDTPRKRGNLRARTRNRLAPKWLSHARCALRAQGSACTMRAARPRIKLVVLFSWLCCSLAPFVNFPFLFVNFRTRIFCKYIVYYFYVGHLLPACHACASMRVPCVRMPCVGVRVPRTRFHACAQHARAMRARTHACVRASCVVMCLCGALVEHTKNNPFFS